MAWLVLTSLSWYRLVVSLQRQGAISAETSNKRIQRRYRVLPCVGVIFGSPTRKRDETTHDFSSVGSTYCGCPGCWHYIYILQLRSGYRVSTILFSAGPHFSAVKMSCHNVVILPGPILVRLFFLEGTALMRVLVALSCPGCLAQFFF